MVGVTGAGMTQEHDRVQNYPFRLAPPFDSLRLGRFQRALLGYATVKGLRFRAVSGGTARLEHWNRD